VAVFPFISQTECHSELRFEKYFYSLKSPYSGGISAQPYNKLFGISFIKHEMLKKHPSKISLGLFRNQLMEKKTPELKDLVIREAGLEDIDEMHRIRLSVKENILTNPDLVKKDDYVKYISTPNKGWVCMADEKIAGFAIVNREEHNVWALFVDPVFERIGIGRLLNNQLIEWYFKQTDHPLWLSTEPGTRAESFYRKAGWIYSGAHGAREIKFEFNSPLTIAQ
jgi:GNAT superfamily N-acetyltransferase